MYSTNLLNIETAFQLLKELNITIHINLLQYNCVFQQQQYVNHNLPINLHCYKLLVKYLLYHSGKKDLFKV